MNAATPTHAAGVEQARRYILNGLDTGRNWLAVLAELKRHGYDGDTATEAITEAVLELERTGQIYYDPDDRVGFRTLHPDDPAPAQLEQVAAAVLALNWNPRGTREKGARSIREAQQELGRYRHCDVFDAMHTILKGRDLSSGIVYWTRLRTEGLRCLCGCGTEVERSTFAPGHDGRFRGLLQQGILTGARNTATSRVPRFESATGPRERLARCVEYLEQLGHPGLAAQLTRDVTTHLPSSLEATLAARAATVAGEPEVTPGRQQVERELVEAYAQFLGRPVKREWPIVAGLRADLLDARRRRIVEAKAAVDPVTVAHAVSQADIYRHLANLHTDVEVDEIAVLLPARPGGLVLDYLSTRLPELGLVVIVIHPNGDGFTELACG